MPKIPFPSVLTERYTMYKIVILGCENSHANNFLRLIAEGHVTLSFGEPNKKLMSINVPLGEESFFSSFCSVFT